VISDCAGKSARRSREGTAASDDGGQLELIALHGRLGDTITLNGLSFTLPRGQVFGFLGPYRPYRPNRPAWIPRLAGTIDGRAVLQAECRLEVGHVVRSAA
jgi:hypothetical protein